MTLAERLIYRGAEADVYRGFWEGVPAVRKVRRPFSYRLPALDATIRRRRTSQEGRMLHSSKRAGVPAPSVLDIDPGQSTIVMELVEGPRLKDVAETKAAAGHFVQLGALAARLHGRGIMHGDLTTANAIVSPQGLVLVDFGLAVHSDRVEDHAVDLRLIKETITGAHPSVAKIALAALLRGYEEEGGERAAAMVLRQLASIERRGRYAKVD